MNILISACLLGEPVRYNATSLLQEHPLLKKWQRQNRLISICPEVAGGMSTPRAPAEIINNTSNTVIDKHDIDVTEPFILGAKIALKLAQINQCSVAIMTERSPSCGSSKIYDGTFTGRVRNGMGIAADLLEKNGIRVFNQHQIDDVELFLAERAG